jgi:hypothetical protein
MAPAVRVEIAIATAEAEADEAIRGRSADPLFRLAIRRWAMAAGDLETLVPMRNPQLRIVTFDFDVSDFLGAQSVADLPATTSPRPSFMAVFGRTHGGRPEPLLVDGWTAQMLMLSDGTRTVMEVIRDLYDQADASAQVDNLEWVDHLFTTGLIWLSDTPSPDFQKIARSTWDGSSATLATDRQSERSPRRSDQSM